VIKLVNRLGAQKVLPVTFSLTQIPLDIQVPYQPLYGRHGAVQTGKATMSPRQFTIQGTIIHRSKANTRQELDALLSFLMQAPIEVYRHHEDTRFLRVYPTGAPQDWIDEGAELGLQLPMVALDPYWYGAEVEESLSAGTTAIEVAGTAATHPIITTIGSVITLAVRNLTNGDEIEITGASGAVEVDTLDYTVTVGAQPALGLANDEWILHGYRLLPGENQIQANTPITVRYRPRWW